MDRGRWQRIHEIFTEILEQDDEGRRARLDHLSPEDAPLRREIESLLARVGRAGSFLEQPAWRWRPPLGPSPGSRVADRYELLRELGRGGMAVVFEARDHSLDRIVAVKVLPSRPTTGELAERFQREAVLAARLEHPGIVPVYDHGADPGHGLFLVMPRVDGTTLRDRLSDAVLSPEATLSLAAQLADALAYSHERGVIHRDVKPENVMLVDGDRRSEVRLMDFGLARALDDSRLTHAGTLLGTPAYMSPEQLLGHEVDGRSDVYSLGAVLYECLAGVVPFGGGTHAVVHAVLNRSAEPLRARGVELPPALDDLILSCLAKDPDDRPSDARTLRDAVIALRSGRPPGIGSTNRASRKGLRRAAVAALVLALTAALAALGFSFLPRAPSATTAGTGPTPPHAATPTLAAPMASQRVRHTASLLANGRVLISGGTTWQPFLGARLRGAETYFPSFDTWRPVPAMAEARDLHVSIPLPDGRLLAVGGEEIEGRLSGLEAFDPRTGEWEQLAGLLVPRHSFTATLLLDGRVLVAGGPPLETEVYDPVTDRWAPAGELSVQRFNPTATRLTDGRVLVVGGRTEGRQLASTEIWDPATGRWSESAPLDHARWLQSATLLRDGRVLVTGGADAESLAESELYDPDADRFVPAASLARSRNRHTATLLADGRVLVAAGNSPHGRLTSVEIYDPEADRWEQGPELEHPRVRHTATLLPDGRVVVVGGESASERSSLDSTEILDPRPAPRVTAAAPTRRPMASPRTALLPDDRVLALAGAGTAEIYDPETDRWLGVPAPPDVGRGPALTWLADGRLLVAGGEAPGGAATGSCAIYDPSAGTWASAAPLHRARVGHTLTPLASGEVLAVGGTGADGSALRDAELYDPAADRWRAVSSPVHARVHHTANLMPDGRVWIAGGFGGERSGEPLAALEIYDPATGRFIAEGSLLTARGHHVSVPWIEPDLPHRRILVIGGEGDGPLAGIEVCGATSCQRMADLSTPRVRPTATWVSDDRILVAGGWSGGGFSDTVATTDLFEVARNLVLPSPPLTEARADHAATVLADGRVLLVGGQGESGPASTAEIYDPRPDLGGVPRPEITEWPEALAPGEPLVLRGRGFRAESAGSGGLGGQDSPTELPLVQATSLVDGRRTYLPLDETAQGHGGDFVNGTIPTWLPGPMRVRVVVQGHPGPSKAVVLRAKR